MKKFDIYQYKAIFLLLCCAVLIATGACSLFESVTTRELRAIYKKEIQRCKKVFKETKAKIDNNQATADDYYFFAHMIYSSSFLRESGMEYLTMDRKTKTDKGEKMYLDYLQKAMKKGSQEAKLDYANFLFQRNSNATDTYLPDKDRKLKYLQLEQAFTLTMEVINTQCEVYKSPEFPKFDVYPEYKVPLSQHIGGLFYLDHKYIKSNDPKLYQRVKQVETAYKEKCEKNKSTKK